MDKPFPVIFCHGYVADNTRPCYSFTDDKDRPTLLYINFALYKSCFKATVFYGLLNNTLNLMYYYLLEICIIVTDCCQADLLK